MANPYSIPYCSVVFDNSYTMLDKLGLSQLFLMPDIWADVLSDLEAAKDINAQVGEASVSTVSTNFSGRIEAFVPDQTLRTLWLDRNTGALLLRPIGTFDTGCSLISSVKWIKGVVGEKVPGTSSTDPATIQAYYGVGSQQSVTSPSGSSQASLTRNNWYPLRGDEYENVWYEVYSNSTELINAIAQVDQRGAVSIDSDYAYKNKEEHFIGSTFQLEQNAPFTIFFTPLKPLVAFKDSSGNPLAQYFRVYFGTNHAIQYDGTKLKYSYDAWANTGSGKEFVDVTGVDLSPRVTPWGTGIALTVQVVGNAIVINNYEDLAPSHAKESRAGWAYLFKDPNSLKNGVTVPQDFVYIGIKGLPVSFTYIPTYYLNTGKLTSRTVDTGVVLNGLAASNESILNNGSVQVSTTVSGTAFSFATTLTRSNSIVNTSPQVFSVNVTTPPTYVTVSINPPIVTGKVRQLVLNHGIFQQTGTVVVDNADGALKSKVGVFPVTINAGWYRGDGTVDQDVRFKGHATSITIDKQGSPYSTAVIQLIGRSQQLVDAVAVNLPIYDGEVHVDAIQSLIQRGGWAQATNFQPNGTPYFTDPTYRLSIPQRVGDQPLYMFSLGNSIWTCIEEIARTVGYWAYVDSKGVFNYVPPFGGTPKQTYREVPSLAGTYDEWQTIQVMKDTSDIKNAVMVVGLDTSFERPKFLVSLIRPPNTSIGFGDPTIGTQNYVPWLRWIIVQDSKINDQTVIDKVCRRIFDNNNRPRWTMRGRVWGDRKIFPLDTIGVNLNKTDQIGMPQGTSGQWRVLSVNETIDGENKTWFMDLECEWIDPRYSYAAWWGRD